jgi:hypothetical protein
MFMKLVGSGEGAHTVVQGADEAAAGARGVTQHSAQRRRPRSSCNCQAASTLQLPVGARGGNFAPNCSYTRFEFDRYTANIFQIVLWLPVLRPTVFRVLWVSAVLWKFWLPYVEWKE